MPTIISIAKEYKNIQRYIFYVCEININVMQKNNNKCMYDEKLQLFEIITEILLQLLMITLNS